MTCRNLTKAEAQTRHALRRARERVSAEWTEGDLAICANRIRAADKEKWAKYRGTAVFVRAQSNRLRLFLILHRETWVPVIYDATRKTIVTVLPLDTVVWDGDRPTGIRMKWDRDLPEGFEAAGRALRDRVELRARPAPPRSLVNFAVDA